MTGVIDTTVIIHLLRKKPEALQWLNEQTTDFFVTPITWLEVLRGANNPTGLSTAQAILKGFQMAYIYPSDADWAIDKMVKQRFSDGVQMNDTLISAVCHRLGLPIYTHNQKDFQKLLPPQQVILPY